MKRHFPFLLFAVVALTMSCTGRKASDDYCPFVQRQGTCFMLNGQEYRFVGTNFWYGAILASEGQGGDRQRLGRELDRLHELGLDNLRILVGSDGQRGVSSKVEPTLQEAPGVYNDTILAGLDYLLQQMGARNMKAVLYLNNSWEWSGGYGFYLEQAGEGTQPRPETHGYPAFMQAMSRFAACDSAHQLFYDYVRFIVKRTNQYTKIPYNEDPAIMAWQIGNEPRAFSEEAKEPFARWLSEASALIRSLDGNHLISIGSEGIWGCENDSTLYARISSDPNIDYLTAHIWPYNWSWARQDSLEKDVEKACSLSRQYLNQHSAIAHNLQKPLVVEEFGYPRDGFVFTPSSPTTARDVYYDFIFSMAMTDSLVKGCNFWAWGGEARPQHQQWMVGDPYMGDPAQEAQGLNSVFDCDSTTIAVIRKYSSQDR
jgi:mannan endo-1,4-beta-mannosidase